MFLREAFGVTPACGPRHASDDLAGTASSLPQVLERSEVFGVRFAILRRATLRGTVLRPRFDGVTLRHFSGSRLPSFALPRVVLAARAANGWQLAEGRTVAHCVAFRGMLRRTPAQEPIAGAGRLGDSGAARAYARGTDQLDVFVTWDGTGRRASSFRCGHDLRSYHYHAGSAAISRSVRAMILAHRS